MFRLAAIMQRTLGQGILTEGEGSVQLTTSLRWLVLSKKVSNIFNLKRSSSKLVSTNVLILPLQ
jgi:hypothetical protein